MADERETMEWTAALLETVLLLYGHELDRQYHWRLKGAIKLLRNPSKHGRRG
jgi:hypothetical protein